VPNFNIFEVLPDGSRRWRTCVSGHYQKDRWLQELAEMSCNEFFALDLATGKTLPYYRHQQWCAAYEEALAETDRAKLVFEILDAENAIVDRLREISISSGYSEERAAMEDAISHLRTIQTEKLGFPKIASESHTHR
jgi:hypothetical protein